MLQPTAAGLVPPTFYGNSNTNLAPGHTPAYILQRLEALPITALEESTPTLEPIYQPILPERGTNESISGAINTF